MAWEKRVIWTEGMMLQPHHFQQQSRYHEAQLRQAIGTCMPFPWGIDSIEIEQSLLKSGKFGITRAQGIFKDGSFFNLPDTDMLPSPIDIDQSHLNATLYLALPVRRQGNNEINREQASAGRYQLAELEVRDVSGVTNNKVHIEIAGLNCSLRTSIQDNSEFVCIAIATVEDVSPNGQVTLGSDFIAPSLNCKSSSHLCHFISELVSLAQHRIKSLAGRVSVAGKYTTSEITDFLMLQTLNRHFPILSYMDSADSLTPFYLYEQLVSLIGDLSTMIQADRMVPELPGYEHQQLDRVFPPIIEQLRHLFSVVLEQNSVNIPLQEKKFGIRVGKISDRSLLSSASFILAVSADIANEEIRQYFPQQVKIGSVESIQELVNLQLPGVQVSPLAAAPREIPYQRHFVYFELVQTGESWQALVSSGGIACHIGTNFPNLNMELWAIRS
ncbi:MAG: type VI secretion system baseplate subunit TssK [Oleibacter sp.]|nr:type VI secretion system baseplate subunit TssK [Thalassolituus sp.]